MPALQFKVPKETKAL